MFSAKHRRNHWEDSENLQLSMKKKTRVFLKQLFFLPRFKKILCKDDVAASQKGTHA
jgi:hypothetical protein